MDTSQKTSASALTYTVYVLSDSSGETAAHVAQAAIVQFPPEAATVRRLPQIRSSADLIRELEKVPPINSIVAYTLVLPEFREEISKICAERGLVSVDLLGPLISKLSALSGTQPMALPGRLHLLDEAYFQRMDAVNFAVQYDDGKCAERLNQADVVLVGVSRTSKTPNSMYLAQHYGLRAANVPFVHNIDPPRSLFEINKRKIVGLSIDPYHLHTIRLTRARVLGISPQSEYADIDEIRREVAAALSLFREIGCHVIDVTTKAVEEVSSEIFLYMKA